MPDLLLRDTSPYGTRRASVLRGDGDVYLYLEDLTGAAPQTASAVWVANHAPAPADSDVEPAASAVRGGPARMMASGTAHPDGCPPFDELDVVWFEEGDAVALVDGHGVVAMIPGWAGSNGFYGYSRYARGESPLAFALSADAMAMLERKVSESRDFWSWRRGPGWT
ncbi:MAG: suppressor of fused domain protein, partial [Aquihabitans sp.]